LSLKTFQLSLTSASTTAKANTASTARATTAKANTASTARATTAKANTASRARATFIKDLPEPIMVETTKGKEWLIELTDGLVGRHDTQHDDT
jgi:predicted regulator of Ras-like GTPase activity (Roadblock/LC7/MglB family)